MKEEKDCPPNCEPKWKQLTRPGSFVLTMFVFFTIMILDGNYGEFAIRDIYVHILEGIIITMIVALFTSRGAEKIVDRLSDKTKEKNDTEF